MAVVEVFFETAGEGEPVVLLNGVMMTTQSWVFQTRRLSETHRDFLTPALLEAGSSRLRSYPPEFFTGFRALCNAFLRLDITDRLHEITAPTLVMCGSLDALKPPRYSEILASRIPNARLEIVDGAGHAVFLEKHEQVSDRLLAFFDGPA